MPGWHHLRYDSFATEKHFDINTNIETIKDVRNRTGACRESATTENDDSYVKGDDNIAEIDHRPQMRTQLKMTSIMCYKVEKKRDKNSKSMELTKSCTPQFKDAELDAYMALAKKSQLKDRRAKLLNNIDTPNDLPCKIGQLPALR